MICFLIIFGIVLLRGKTMLNNVVMVDDEPSLLLSIKAGLTVFLILLFRITARHKDKSHLIERKQWQLLT